MIQYVSMKNTDSFQKISHMAQGVFAMGGKKKHLAPDHNDLIAQLRSCDLSTENIDKLSKIVQRKRAKQINDCKSEVKKVLSLYSLSIKELFPEHFDKNAKATEPKAAPAPTQKPAQTAEPKAKPAPKPQAAPTSTSAPAPKPKPAPKPAAKPKAAPPPKPQPTPAPDVELETLLEEGDSEDDLEDLFMEDEPAAN